MVFCAVRRSAKQPPLPVLLPLDTTGPATRDIRRYNYEMHSHISRLNHFSPSSTTRFLSMSSSNDAYKLVHNIDLVLKLLPPEHSAPLYRVEKRNEEFIAALKPGQVISNVGYTSTSKNPNFFNKTN